jgi:hypothetical protein
MYFGTKFICYTSMSNFILFCGLVRKDNDWLIVSHEGYKLTKQVKPHRRDVTGWAQAKEVNKCWK